MRGLTAMEREMLVASSRGTIPDDSDPDCTLEEQRAVSSLVARGCVRMAPVTPNMETFHITPRGRLALLCHQAVTAGMVSA